MATVLSYQTYQFSGGQECPICQNWDDNNNEITAVAHQGGGTGHPLHLSCARTWHLNRNDCPLCHQITDVSFLFPNNEHLKGIGKRVKRSINKIITLLS